MDMLESTIAVSFDGKLRALLEVCNTSADRTMLARLLARELKATILEVLALRPCHVSGEHNPTHTLNCVCNLQRRESWDALLEALGVAEGDLPRKLHEDCCWCRDSSHRDELARWVGGENGPNI